MEFDSDNANRDPEDAVARLDRREESKTVEHLLKKRAEELARRSHRRGVRPGANIERVIAFRRGETTLAIRTHRIMRIQWMRICELRFGPPAVIGIVMEGSAPISVVDIGRPVRPLGHMENALVMSCVATSGPIGLVIDEVLGPRAIAQVQPISHLSLDPFLEGRAEDGLFLINLDALSDWSEVRVG